MQRRDFTRLGAASLAAAALPRAARAADPMQVGLIYLGPIGDFGWSYQHDAARKLAQEHFGDQIKTTYVESVPEGPDCENVMRDLAQKGCKVIFATSFGYMNYVLKVAKQFPAVKFEHATGYKRAANVATYNIRFYQARYVQGMIAGHLSKSGTAGYIGSVPVPEVVQGLNAFILGMRSVNPEAKLKFIMVNAWYDPPKEGGRSPRDQGVRAVHRHGEVRAEDRAHLQRRQLVALLHRAHPGGARRNMEERGHLGRLRQRHA